MALLGNYSVILKNPATFIGGTQVSNCRNAFNQIGQIRRRYYADTTEGLPLTAALPTGTEPSYSYLIPYKGGEMSSTTAVRGSGSLTSNIASGKALESVLTGSGTINNASLSLVTSLIAALSGSGTLTGSMVGTIQMASALAGSGSLTASAGLIANIVAELAGSGSLTSDLKGKLSMAADIFVNSGTAEVNQLVAAIWSALAADYNESGTMGEKLNGAGSAGDPWTTDLDGYTTEGTAGKILKDAKKAAKTAASLSA